MGRLIAVLQFVSAVAPRCDGMGSRSRYRLRAAEISVQPILKSSPRFSAAEQLRADFVIRCYTGSSVVFSVNNAKD